MSIQAVHPRKNRIRPPMLTVSSQLITREKVSQSHLTQVSPQVFISSYEAAKNPDLLASESITHILNLAGEAKCPNPFSASFHYFSMKMPDNPKIDILFFLYFAMEFIINSVRSKGKVLIHCVKGTSRAAAVALAYLMLQGYSEQEAYEKLSKANPEIDPNFGFVCQLKEFKSRRSEPRVFCYSKKYEMFVNTSQQEASSIIIADNECALYLDKETSEFEQETAFASVSLWEKFNSGKASIVYV